MKKTAIALDDRIDLKSGGNDLLAAGELLVDIVSVGDAEADGAECRLCFGGSPSNIAMNAKRLGLEPLAAACVGRDRLGDFLARRMELAGLDTRLVQRADEPTSVVVVNKSSATPVPIFYRGADFRLACAPELESAAASAKIFHFSCWPISMQPSRGAIEAALEKARESGSLVCFDPNYHPALWGKGDDGRSRVESAVARADVVKPSMDDAQRIFGKDTPENHARRFVELGARLVIMTLGKDGALVTNGAQSLRLPSMATGKAEDATGAGDAFWAGFYAAIVKGSAVREAVSVALAASAHKLKHVGALADLPPLEKLKEAYGL